MLTCLLILASGICLSYYAFSHVQKACAEYQYQSTARAYKRYARGVKELERSMRNAETEAKS